MPKCIKPVSLAVVGNPEWAFWLIQSLLKLPYFCLKIKRSDWFNACSRCRTFAWKRSVLIGSMPAQAAVLLPENKAFWLVQCMLKLPYFCLKTKCSDWFNACSSCRTFAWKQSEFWLLQCLLKLPYFCLKTKCSDWFNTCSRCRTFVWKQSVLIGSMHAQATVLLPENKANSDWFNACSSCRTFAWKQSVLIGSSCQAIALNVWKQSDLIKNICFHLMNIRTNLLIKKIVPPLHLKIFSLNYIKRWLSNCLETLIRLAGLISKICFQWYMADSNYPL